ncbi:MAG: hypothetical protein JSS74_05485 [Actinobacteria bacterium]|nr:hypothetical protein [Actinomycetota bacterium]
MRVIIVDDHAVFRESLRAVLQDRDGIDVVDDVGTGVEAIASAEQRALPPDVGHGVWVFRLLP